MQSLILATYALTVFSHSLIITFFIVNLRKRNHKWVFFCEILFSVTFIIVEVTLAVYSQMWPLPKSFYIIQGLALLQNLVLEVSTLKIKLLQY